MSDPVNDYEDARVFDESLSKWIGLGGSVLCDPAPLDLHTAASIGETELVREILDERRIRVNSLNRGGWSALMYASYMGHSDTIRFLLGNGADPNQRTPQGSTSLILAAMCGYDVVMSDILQKGGDLEAKDNRGWTALFHAVSSGHQQTTEYLLNAGANLELVEPTHRLTPLMEAAASGHENVVHQLLKFGADFNRTDINGDNAQSLACLYGHMEVAQLIQDFKHENKRPSQRKSNRASSEKNRSSLKPTSSYGSSGPSIHAGPRAFAEMTGLGSDGKPKPSAAAPLYLQEQEPQSKAHNHHFESKWKGPKDLAALLEELGFTKYLSLFKDQDIDLRIFLTLTEADLKEIGIKLFGPRRKMIAAIGRINDTIQGSLIDKVELAFCDSLLVKLKSLEDKLKESKEKNMEFSSQLAQEKQLRSVAEGVLIEQKEFKSAIHRCIDKLRKEHHNVLLAAEVMHSSYSRNNPGNTRQQVNRHSPSAGEGVEGFHTALKHSNDCLLEMQRLLRTFGSTTVPQGHGGN